MVLAKSKDRTCEGCLKIGHGEFVFEMSILHDKEVEQRGLRLEQKIMEDELQFCSISVRKRKKGKKPIQLEDDEYFAFRNVISWFFFQWIEHPAVLLLIMARQDARLEEEIAALGLNKLGMPAYSGDAALYLSPKNCRIFNRPKFQCQLQL